MAQMTATPAGTQGFFVDGKWIEEGDPVEIRSPYDGSGDRFCLPGQAGTRRGRDCSRGKSFRHHPAASGFRTPARAAAGVGEHLRAQAGICPHHGARGGQADQGCADRGRACHLYLQRCRRGEHADLRRVPAARLAGVYRRTLGHCAPLSRWGRLPESLPSIFP